MKYDLKKLRKKLGLTASDVGEQFNCTEQNIYYLEKKKAYPEYMKDWMNELLAEKKRDEGDLNYDNVNKRLRELEKEVFNKENGDV